MQPPKSTAGRSMDGLRLATFFSAALMFACSVSPARAEVPQVVFRFVDSEGRRVENERLACGEVNDTGVRGIGGIETDENGECRKSMLNCRKWKRLMFGTPSLGYCEQTVLVEDAQPGEIIIVRLKKYPSLTGAVREQETRRPLGGTVLTPYRVKANGERDEESTWNQLFGGLHCRYVQGYPITVISRDGDGAFALQNLPPGEYRLSVENDVRRKSLRVSLPSKDQERRLEVTLPPKSDVRAVSGKVLSPNGDLLRNTNVEIVVDSMAPGESWYGQLRGIPRRVRTDDEGRFLLFPFEDRWDCWLTASVKNFRSSKTLKVKASKESVDLNLQVRSP